MQISEATRRDIFDSLMLSGISWSGRLEEHDFLQRIFDLKNMPSNDGRFPDASGDIWQHRVSNPYDWPDNWIVDDTRFNLLNTDDAIFLSFLCEILHPAVQPDLNSVLLLVEMFNDHLRSDGYELVEVKRLAGRPVFAAEVISLTGNVALGTIQDAFRGTDANYVDKQIARMKDAVSSDPDLAIGTAKELVETCCRSILLERGIEPDKNWDLGQLVKQTTNMLALTPNDIPDQAKAADTIRRLLSNLGSVTQGLAELRNHYGTGHGKSASTKGLQSRHARLAVGAASTLAAFLVETHKVRPLVKK